MIARIRGDDHQQHWGRWRPHPSRQPPDRDQPQPRPPDPRPQSPTTIRRATRPLVLLAATAVSLAAIHTTLAHRAQPVVVLPATPRAWLDAYDAAAAENPARVCSQLFAPPLAAAYARDAHRSCRRFFAHVTVAPVRVSRVLRAGNTAVLELRLVIRHQAWAVVLDHRPGGWQAVDVMDGRLIR